MAQCPQCPSAPWLCWSCLSPLKITPKTPTGRCINRSCHLVNTLLTCDTITDNTYLQGCPVFRACPKCRCLLMHSSGCKFATCQSCKHKFCFVCLQPASECRKDNHLYFLPSCSKPRASRQIFHS